ncbi:hypothetical protein OAD49_00020 [Flavobacteriaceae bacterium]|nr:hypothetical protein [Flavobacteriaceae bacterium]
MKTTKINMKKVGETNPFYTAKWTDASPEKTAEVFAIISQIGNNKTSRLSK